MYRDTREGQKNRKFNCEDDDNNNNFSKWRMNEWMKEWMDVVRR